MGAVAERLRDRRQQLPSAEPPDNGGKGPVRTWTRFRQDRRAVVALVFIGAMALAAVVGPHVVPHDPNAQDLRNTLASPLSGNHVLGTDELGRDVLSRLVLATRVALQACGVAVVIGVVGGVPLGLLAGYVGGWIDLVLARIGDALQSLPPLIIAMALVGALGPGLTNAMIAVGIVFIPVFFRLTRASVLEVRAEAYVEASVSIGSSTPWIMLVRVVPNILPTLLVQATLASGFALLAEASLSFLGLGVQPPEASWGSMLGEGYEFLQVQPWLIVFPGVAIALAVLAINVLGDGIRDATGRAVRRA